MIPVTYPHPAFRIENRDNKEFIFDPIRKQWIRLTGEEWVRQNFVQFLVQEMHYPDAFIAIEKEIQLGDLKKRFDILVYDKAHKPWMLVECKAPEIMLDEKTFRQVLRYNISVPVSYLVITNGDLCLGWERGEGALKEILLLPAWC